MRYIGSKIAMLPVLTRLVRRRAPTAHSLCDPFAGTCTVSSHFKSLGFEITTGDVLNVSYAFQIARVGLNRLPAFLGLSNYRDVPTRNHRTRMEAVLTHLNGLPPANGYITKNFSTVSDGRRAYFTKANAGKIDAIRTQVADWATAGKLSASEEQLLLMLLIDASDRVASTAGTYYAHLKKLSRKATQNVSLRVPNVFNNKKENSCNLADARDLVSETEADILYLDPPYNERDYNSYYHLPETISIWDAPKPKGKSGVPARARQGVSDFCKRITATDALAEILCKATSRYILIHYAKDGLIRHSDIRTMLAELGETRFDDYPVRAYGTSAQDGDVARSWHRIYWCDTHA